MGIYYIKTTENFVPTFVPLFVLTFFFFFDGFKRISSAEFSRQVFRKNKHQDLEGKRFSKQHAVIALSTREEKKGNN